MSNNNEKVQKKQKMKKKFRRISILIVIIYLIIRSLPSIVATNSKTVFAEEDILIKSTRVPGVIIRDEMIYKAKSSGKIVAKYEEGAKISSGIEVMTIDDNYSKTVEKKAKDEIKELEKIDELNLQNFSTKDLQDMINTGDFENVHKAKKILEEREKNKVEDEQNIGDNQKPIEKIIEELDTTGKYFSESGGLISYYIDGYEGKYTVDSMGLLNYDSIVIEKNKEVSNLVAEAGSPAYKIIDNFQWYIALKLDSINDYKNLEVGDLLKLRIDDNPKEFASRVIHINKDKAKNKGVIVIRLTEGLHDFTDTRFVDVELINKKIDGLKIPNKAIIEQEKKKGVFIKDVSGVVRFKEVKILGKDDTNTFVDKGDERSFVEIEKDIKIKTITIFDEIFLNSNSLREGQIID